MRVAQRELKVKVTADISASFKKLINMLEKRQTLNVKVNVSDGGLKKMTDKLNKLANKKVSVKVNAESKNLDRLSKKLDGLKDKKVSVKADTAGLGGMSGELDKAKAKAEELNNTKISPTGVAAGLAPLMVTLDQISDKILSIANQTIAPVVKDTWSDSMDLFDTQKSFEVQMKGLGMADKQLNQIIKDMNAYGKQSKYSIAQMLNAYSEFKGAGDEDPAKLIKGMAGLASYGKNPNQGFNALLTNLTEGANTDSLYTGDWRQIRKAIGASASKSLRDWFKVNKGIELTKDNLSEGKITVGDFKEAIEAVGNGDTFQKMATQTNTLRSAYDNLKESLTSAMIGDLDNKGPLAKLGETLVKQINDFSKATPMIAKQISQGLDYVFDVFGKNLKDFNAKDFLKDFANSFKSAKPIIDVTANLLGKLTNNGKDAGKALAGLIKFAVGWKMFRGLAQPVLSLASAGATLLKVAQSFNLLKFKGGGFFSKLFGAFGAKGNKGPNMNKIKAQALNMAKNLATVAGVIGTVWVGAKAFESVSKMDIDFGSLTANLGKVAVGLAASSAILWAIGKAVETFPQIASTIAVGALATTALTGSIALITKFTDSSVKNLASIGKRIEKLSDLDIQKVLIGIGKISLLSAGLGTLGSIQAVSAPISAVGGLFASIGNLAQTLNIETLMLLVDKINRANLPDSATLSEKLSSLRTLIYSLAGFNLGNLPADIASGLSTLPNIFSSIGNLAQSLNIDTILPLINKINNAEIPDAGQFTTKINNLKQIVKAISTISSQGLGDAAGGMVKSGVDAIGSKLESFNVGNILSIVNKTKQVLTALNSVQISMDTVGTIKDKLKAMKSVISAVQNFMNGGESSGVIDKVGKAVGNTVDAFNAGQVLKQVQDLSSIATTISSLPAVDGATQKINAIKNAINEILALSFSASFDSSAQFAGGDGAGGIYGFSSIVGKVKKFAEIGTALNGIPAIADDIHQRIMTIENAINQLMGLSFSKEGEASGITQLNQILTQVNNLLTQLQALTTQFTSTGTSYAQALVNGFNSGNINQIVTKVQNVKDRISEKADLTSIGKKMSDTLNGGFNADGLIKKINSIQSAIDSLKGKTVDININTHYNDLFNTSSKKGKKKGDGHSFNGGIIPEYHSDGGRVGMRPKGSMPWYTGSRRQRNTDSVPTMLTPGEYVLKRSVSNALGKGFLDALNNMNLSSAMARLQNKVNGGYTDQRVTNNYITQNVDNKASYLNGLGTIRRTVRL